MVEGPNIILVVLDTLRKDVLGTYSGIQTNTPCFDNFCDDAIDYGNCIAPSPWTIPSHASLFSGMYPSMHEIHETPDAKCLALTKTMNTLDIETLPEFLQRKKGYDTLGFSTNCFIRPGSGFDRGFDKFCYTDIRGIEDDQREVIEEELRSHEGDRWQLSEDLLKAGQFRKLVKLYLAYCQIRKRQKSLNYPAEKGGNTLLRNIECGAKLDSPFFLFVNFMELHEPYVRYEMDHLSSSLEDLFGTKAMPLQVLTEIKRRYYLAANRLDGLFGRLIGYLRGKNAYNDSLIIVLSDHGQAFRERNYYGHGLFLYDEIVKVPLIVKFPHNRKFPALEGYQSLVDIPSFIREVTEDNVAVDSLTREQVFSESYGIHQQFIPKGKGERREEYDVRRKAIFRDGYKLVLNLSLDTVEEFSYRKKTLDHKDSEHIAVVDSLLSELYAFSSHERMNHLPSPTHSSNPFRPDEELIIFEKLRTLGYC